MSSRGITTMSVGGAVVLAGYVLGGVADVDLGSALGGAKLLVIAAAVLVAALAFQLWSHHSAAPTLCAMALGLLGGASLASSITTARGSQLYASDTMALIGTVSVVAAVTLAQVTDTRSGPRDNAHDDRRNGAR